MGKIRCVIAVVLRRDCVFKTSKSFLFFISLFGAIRAGAQNTPVPRDTSFTIESSYVKEKKNFPFIQIAKPTFPPNIKATDKITYDSIGNRGLKLQVYFPAKPRKNGYPGVLLIHGGGWRTGVPSQVEAFAWRLASLGYVTVAVEYRLSIEAQYPAGMQDVKTAIRWMKSNGKKYTGYDKDCSFRIFIWGADGCFNGDNQVDGEVRR